ncbi:MAG: hypothetical protein QOC94_2850 [Actinoplanes sp.]|nr:hypothetical protein [Actinoplanes sp.]
MPAHAVYPSGELTGAQDRYPAPCGHRRQIDVFRNDQENADLCGQVQDEIVRMVVAVVDGAGRAQNPAPEASACGESQSANSAASLMIPRQSANGLSDVGGGEGHERYGLFPVAIACTSTLTSKTTGVATGPATFWRDRGRIATDTVAMMRTEAGRPGR